MAESKNLLQKYFNIGFKKSAQKKIDKLYPLKNDPKKSGEKLSANTQRSAYVI